MILEKTAIVVSDELDFVRIKFGCLEARIGYRIALIIPHYMRMAAKQAARFDRAPASFWREVEAPDLSDIPRVNRFPRQSKLTPTISNWEVCVNPPLVGLVFDNKMQEMDYETAVKLSNAIRLSARRAKAWAGDSSSQSRMLGNLTDAEEDYKLGLG